VTFQLVRLNWPNTAAIAALALLPMIALTPLAPTPSGSLSDAGRSAAANCPMEQTRLVTLARAEGASLE
jgi:hypothetical protein